MMASLDLQERHYKDASPLDTIQHIRNLLHANGIFTCESQWHHSGRHYHSLSLNVSGTPVSVNGKGTTPILALASAYGELMERLQNLAPFRLIHDFSDEDWKSFGFFYAPDEASLTIGDLVHCFGPWLQYQCRTLPRGINPLATALKWKQVSRIDDERAPFHAVPFYHVASGSLEYIPMEMISKMYTSNGMAAGNTMEEALVQGLSEIFERYANIRLLYEPITPPDIPREWITASPFLAGLVEDIESDGRYTLRFKDCSLGMGLPVVATICTDAGMGRYFVKFGAHPMFEIAVERTLTEMLQGQDLQDMKGFQAFSYTPPIKDNLQNMMGILISGIGKYPQTFLAKTEDLPSNSHWQAPCSNAKLLKSMVDYIKTNGWDLFVRNVSFLGFPACQIVVSGISEVEPFFSYESIEEYKRYVRLCKRLRDLEKSNAVQKEALADELAQLNMGYASPLEVLHLQVGQPPWAYQSIDFLLIALYASIGCSDKAASHWESFLSEYEANNGMDEPLYYRCAANYLRMAADGRPPYQIRETLCLFYPSDMVAEVMQEFSIAELQTMPWFPCFDCDACAYNAQCDHPALSKLFLTLKRAYASHPIDQRSFSGFFKKIGVLNRSGALPAYTAVSIYP